MFINIVSLIREIKMEEPLYKRIIIIFLLLFKAHFALIANNYTIQDILSAPFPTGLTLSPSGKRVAWVFSENGVRNIWIAEAPRFKGKALTNNNQDIGQDLSSLIFLPKEDKLIFVRGSSPNRKGEIPNPTSLSSWPKQEICLLDIRKNKIYVLDEGSSPSLSPNGKILSYLKKGQVWCLEINNQKEKGKEFQIRGSASSLRWSSDSKKLAFVSNRGDHSFIGVYNFNDKKITYLSPSLEKDTSPVWSKDNNRIAYIKTPNEKNILPFEERREGLPWSIHIANSSTGEAKEIWKAKEGMGSVFRSVSAKNQIFWTADDHIIFPYEKEGFTHLYSVKTTGQDEKLLTPGSFEVQFVSMSQNDLDIYFSSNQNDIDRQHIWMTNSQMTNPDQLTSGLGVEWSPTADNNGNLFVLASSYNLPAHPYKVNKNGTLNSLAPKAIPKSFPKNILRKPEQIVFESSNGIKIHNQLFLPANYDEDKNYPALIYFHGGSRRQMLLGFHHRGYYHNAFAMNQFLADQGYIVLSVNYRSGIGYGMKFREAINYGANGASEYQDVVAAGNYLRSRKDVDKKRIGLWGGSYGGYLTAMGLAKNSDMFAAGVDIHGAHDWNIIIKNFRPSYNPLAKPDFAQRAFESSPMNFIKSWKSPVLLIHGDDDRNVPFSESVDLAEELRKHNVYFEQLVFPDEVHGFLLHENWVKAFQATDDFFRRMLK